MKAPGWAGLALLLAVAGCHRRVPPAPAAPIRYLIEPAWQASGVWFYPRETFAYDQTGIAEPIPASHPPLTADNEPYDPGAMAAAMQEVQLPAIATITDLETGREVTVRVNDRGPANPARLIAVTPRVAALLGMGAAARVRVRFDEAMTMALSRTVQGKEGELAITAAPRGDVRQTQLAPLAGASSAAPLAHMAVAPGAQAVNAAPVDAAPVDAASVEVPLRLPEQLRQAPVEPGVLMLRAGTFTHEDSARLRRDDLADLGARVVRSEAGGQTTFQVQAGPYDTIAAADAAMARALRDGVNDARLAVDLR